jgi:hypothetical protein
LRNRICFLRPSNEAIAFIDWFNTTALNPTTARFRDDDGHSGANQRQPTPHLNNCYCHHCDRTATNAMQFFRRHRDSPTVQIEVENIAQSKAISLIIDLQINTTTRNKGSKQQSTNDVLRNNRRSTSPPECNNQRVEAMK